MRLQNAKNRRPDRRGTCFRVIDFGRTTWLFEGLGQEEESQQAETTRETEARKRAFSEQRSFEEARILETFSSSPTNH